MQTRIWDSKQPQNEARTRKSIKYEIEKEKKTFLQTPNIEHEIGMA